MGYDISLISFLVEDRSPLTSCTGYTKVSKERIRLKDNELRARPKQYVDPKIYEVFAYQDFNKDGLISLDEAYELGLRSKPRNVSAKKLRDAYRTLIYDYDLDFDRALDYVEYLKYYNRKVKSG
ncbi:hypothetical protein RRG08_056520 [Elysia crispata]|uniref:EF-hand domain-containing protein n=1 Tax=Elysia crispata TaxID=231223 RepID=A0AAE1CR27_9GAST|nr:hypothetical protein RRG08_056520 [Elysia crispata]